MAKLPYNRIPRFIGPGNYETDVFWRGLQDTLDMLSETAGLDLDPDFQRGNVWTEAQQKAYVEFVVRGGNSGKTLLFNCPGWPHSHEDQGPVELVDGKQRLTAVLRFIRDEMTIFDSFPGIGPTLFSEFEVQRDIDLRFKIYVNALNTRAEVLEWYLQVNDGGTAHTKEELDKVRKMLGAKKIELVFPREAP